MTMSSRRKNRLYLVVLVLLGVITTIALILYALRSNIDLFYTPGEILNGKGAQHEKPEVGQRLRIGGMVLPGSVQRAPDSLQVTFKLYDAKGVVEVTYDGVLPDLFREGQGIVAQGVLMPGQVIQANEVLAKHDENYTPPEIQQAMETNHHTPAKPTPSMPAPTNGNAS